MALLQKQHRGDPGKYAPFAQKAAHRAEACGEWDRARVLGARWHEIAKNQEQRNAALVAAAETYIHDAESRIRATGGNYLAAAGLYGHGIEALRRVGGMQARVAQLHGTLLLYQEKGVAEMSNFAASTPLENAEEYLECARVHVCEKPSSECPARARHRGCPTAGSHGRAACVGGFEECPTSGYLRANTGRRTRSYAEARPIIFL